MKGSSGRARTYNPPVNSGVTLKTRKVCQCNWLEVKPKSRKGFSRLRDRPRFPSYSIISTNISNVGGTESGTFFRRVERLAPRTNRFLQGDTDLPGNTSKGSAVHPGLPMCVR